MSGDSSVIGRATTRYRVVIERGPVANFARAVTDRSPVAPGSPAPPTFPFVARNWGAFAEMQDDFEPVDSDPMAEIVGGSMANGGLILHGEQSFEYHRPLVVGDVLRVEGRVADIYEKESKGRVMTFVVVESTWTDEASGELVLTERMNLIHRA